MGTFERLSVVVIGVILVMILVVAVVTWTEEPEEGCLPGEAGASPRSVARLDDPPSEPLPPLPSPLPPAPGPIGPSPDPLPPVPQPEPAPPQPDPVPAPGPKSVERRVHAVAEGDTLSAIAEKYLPSHKYWPAIVKINPSLDPNALRLGQEVQIPTEAELGLKNEPKRLDPQPGPRSADAPKPGGTWTVREGDDLRRIAKQVYRNLERWPDIWLANRERITNPEEVPAGTVLTLPE